ncbi:MAG: hypothetical protein AAFY76_25260 [Cyanobacteria bacterium J06649_11]
MAKESAPLLKGEPKKNPQDDVDVYVNSLAADLHQFQQREYLMAKQEIQCIIFKYQMNKYHQSTLTRPAMSRENINIKNHQQQRAYQNWINN